ncbi:hypothetical protein VNO77_39318 [Canavalia gladiata]|uniref:Uncharacterized protein n=1 Tax=Canavalia gladiata TaxID=3824 RepID=A0AAN9KCC3_CANGL
MVKLGESGLQIFSLALFVVVVGGLDKFFTWRIRLTSRLILSHKKAPSHFKVAGLHTPRHYPGQNCCLPVCYYALDGLINTDRIQCQVMNDAFVSEPESSYQVLVNLFWDPIGQGRKQIVLRLATETGSPQPVLDWLN